MRDFIAKKHIVLMNDEPIELWLKNGEVKKAKFMDKQINLKLESDTIKQIRDNPTRVVNGNNLSDNLDFTKNISKMMSQQLDLAIAKNDKKTLSRFARSELVPANMKDKFIEAINSPKGLRGALVKAVNKTNSILQNLTKTIDRFFDKLKDKIVNKKLDKYLEEYQLKEFNKAPPAKDLDLSQSVDKKLKDLSQDFVKKNSITELSDTKTSDKLLQNDFMQQATRAGLNAVEAKTALFQTVLENQHQKEYIAKTSQVESMEKIIDEMQSKLDIFEKKEASKNETLEDFKIITKDIGAVDKIDFLIENKEYLAMSESQKLETENRLLHEQEPIQERAKELKELVKIIDNAPKFETVKDRTPTLNFSDKSTQTDITNKWSELQKINREQKAQNRDFMNVSAVKFNGVSQKSLENWQEFSKGKGTDQEAVKKFVDASLRNAKELVKAGVMNEVSKGEFKFVDNFAKETLFKNLDKTNDEIAKANLGKDVQVEINQKSELQERVQNISSDKSFEKLLNANGEIDSQQLHKFADHLQNLATQLHTQEKANTITEHDLKLAENGQSKTQSRDAGRERA